MRERNNKRKAGSLDRQCLPADDGANARRVLIHLSVSAVASLNVGENVKVQFTLTGSQRAILGQIDNQLVEDGPLGSALCFFRWNPFFNPLNQAISFQDPLRRTI
jgi:hypothetical protein